MVESTIGKQKLARIQYNEDNPKAPIKLLKENFDGNPDNQCITIGILGREQVGKSTLMNAMFMTNFTRNQDDIARRTTDGIDYSLQHINGIDVHLLDCEGFFSDKVMTNLKKEKEKNKYEQWKDNDLQNEVIERNKLGGLRMVKFMSQVCDIIFILMKHGDTLNFLIDNLKLSEKSYVSQELLQKSYFIIRVPGSNQEKVQTECIHKIQETLFNYDEDEVASRCKFLYEITPKSQLADIALYTNKTEDELYERQLQLYQESIERIDINSLIEKYQKDICTQFVSNTVMYAAEFANSFQSSTKITQIQVVEQELEQHWTNLITKFKNQALATLKNYEKLKSEAQELKKFVQDDKNLDNLRKAALSSLKIEKNTKYLSAPMSIVSGFLGIGCLFCPILWVPSLCLVGGSVTAVGTGYLCNRNNTNQLNTISQSKLNEKQESIQQILQALKEMKTEQFCFLQACYYYTSKGEQDIFEQQKEQIKQKFKDLMSFLTRDKMKLYGMTPIQGVEFGINKSIQESELASFCGEVSAVGNMTTQALNLVDTTVKVYKATEKAGEFTQVGKMVLSVADISKMQVTETFLQTVGKIDGTSRLGYFAENSLLMWGKGADKIARIAQISKVVKVAGPVFSAFSIAIEGYSLAKLIKKTEAEVTQEVEQNFRKMKELSIMLESLLVEIHLAIRPE